MSERIKVHIDRRCLVRGDVFEPGRVVALEPLDAAAVVDNLKGHLVDAADATRVREAVLADTKRVLHAMGRLPGGPAPSPWIPYPR